MESLDFLLSETYDPVLNCALNLHDFKERNDKSVFIQCFESTNLNNNFEKELLKDEKKGLFIKMFLEDCFMLGLTFEFVATVEKKSPLFSLNSQICSNPFWCWSDIGSQTILEHLKGCFRRDSVKVTQFVFSQILIQYIYEKQFQFKKNGNFAIISLDDISISVLHKDLNFVTFHRDIQTHFQNSKFKFKHGFLLEVHDKFFGLTNDGFVLQTVDYWLHYFENLLHNHIRKNYNSCDLETQMTCQTMNAIIAKLHDSGKSICEIYRIKS